MNISLTAMGAGVFKQIQFLKTNLFLNCENFPLPFLFKEQNKNYVILHCTYSHSLGITLVFTGFPVVFVGNIFYKMASFRTFRKNERSDGSNNRSF